MALHDVETMQAIEQAVHAVNPRAILYGEGWTGGTSALRENLQASQKNIRQVVASEGAAGSVAVFNDVIRDGLKGSVFDAAGTGYINGSASKTNANRVGFGLTGGADSGVAGWSVEGAMVTNYMSSHDNQTLWDKLAYSAPDASEEERLAMNRLGAAAVFFSRGTPFMLAGEEMLRTKGGNGNSYNASDEVNNLDWAALTPESDAWAMSRFYRTLIAVRRDNDFLRRADVAFEVGAGNAILVTWTEGGDTVARAVLNGGGDAFTLTGCEGWEILLRQDGSAGGAAPAELTVPPCGFVLVKR